MNLTRIASALLCLLLGGTAVARQTTPAKPADSFTDRIYGLAFTEAAFSCRYGQKPRTDVDAEALIREYLKTRGLADEPRTRALVDALLDFQRYPTVAHLDRLEERHAATGLRASVAEDIAFCIRSHSPYPRERVGEHIQALAAVRPAPVGLFWAARSQSSNGETAKAIEYFQRALDADTRSSRTRLFYAVTLLKERRPARALAILEPIPRSWAPEATAYWRAQALMALNRPRQARALLERLPRWVHTFETTPPGALDALTVSLPTMPGCAIATTYSLEGQQARAREMLVAIKNCPEDLVALELRFGHPYRALEILEEPYYPRSYRHSEMAIEARARLGACEWARQHLGRLTPTASVLELQRKVGASCPIAQMPREVTNPALLARLAAPRLTAFTERPLARLSDVERWKKQRPAPITVRYPALVEYAVFAVSPPAQRMFAASFSAAIDPGRHAYPGIWLHVSSDAGKHWEGPYYLGLSQRFPVDTRFVAHRPSSNGKRLPLEVQNLQITFPPASSPSARRVERLEHYMLDIDLDMVRRDSDGDGLTDLFEEKLMLDPHARDTDGDGIADAQDMLPLEARDADVPSYVRQVWTALLPVFTGDQRLPRESQAPTRLTAVEGTRPLRKERTLFISGSGCPASHTSAIRAICLTPELRKLYSAKFGDLLPMDLSHIVFDEKREHALIDYAFPYSGGTLRATKGNGEWLFQRISDWIE